MFVGGEGVRHPTQDVELAGNPLGVPTAGALEEHVLSKMGAAVVTSIFVAGTHLDPDPQGDQA